MSGAGRWHNHELPKKAISLYHCSAVFGVATRNADEMVVKRQKDERMGENDRL
jgi:hypothetical protein